MKYIGKTVLSCLLIASSAYAGDDDISFYVDGDDTASAQDDSNNAQVFSDEITKQFEQMQSDMLSSFHNLWNDVDWRKALHSGVDMMSNKLDEMAKDTETKYPTIDIKENDKVVKVDISLKDTGIKPEDMDITVKKGLMKLEAEQRIKSEEKKSDGSKSVSEKYSMYQKSFTIPKNINADNAEIEQFNEAITVTIPKE